MSVILTAAEMRAADEKTIQSGTPSRTLMERAANAALQVLLEHFDTTCTLFLCGCGNNGGDAFAMARFLSEQQKCARVLYVGALDACGRPDAAKMSVECTRQYSLLPTNVRVETALDLAGVSAVVDGIFGIGLTRPVEEPVKGVIEAVRTSGIPVLALDVPSGVNADSGAVMGVALPAAHTVSMAAAKWGHYLYPGTLLCGTLTVADIGIYAEKSKGKLLQKSDIYALPPRPPRAHKGTYGRVLVIGGAVGMSGAAYFAAKAALRAGAGLVEIFAPHDNRIIYQTQLPEALLTLYDPDAFDETVLKAAISRADAVAVGMGLTQSETAAQMVACTLKNAEVPVIADADALNLISQRPALMAHCATRTVPTILTPHLGEMSRLTGIPVPLLAAELPKHAEAYAKACGAIVALKDARTVVSDGETLYLNVYGNSGMATGGSGDVLAGVIASFAAQGAAPMDAARLGVLAHALAGDAAMERCGNHGLMASDIIDGLCRVLP